MERQTLVFVTAQQHRMGDHGRANRGWQRRHHPAQFCVNTSCNGPAQRPDRRLLAVGHSVGTERSQRPYSAGGTRAQTIIVKSRTA